jgi:hypothetical protein
MDLALWNLRFKIFEKIKITHRWRDILTFLVELMVIAQRKRMRKRLLLVSAKR